MSEVEGLTENSEEHIHHAAHEGPKWISLVALSTAILAAFAAVTALLSGSNEGEAALHQQQSSDQWAYYQAKGIKLKEDQNTALLTDKIEALTKKLGQEKAAKPVAAAGAPAPEAEASESDKLKEKVAQYKEDQEKISEKAKELEAERDQELKAHHIYSKGVTLFQIAIAIGAISALTKQRRYWGVSLAFGALGLAFLIGGLAVQFAPHASPAPEQAEHPGH